MLILLGKWKYPLESSLLLGNHFGINALIYIDIIFLDNLHSHLRWTAAAAFIYIPGMQYLYSALSCILTFLLHKNKYSSPFGQIDINQFNRKGIQEDLQIGLIISLTNFGIRLIVFQIKLQHTV